MSRPAVRVAIAGIAIGMIVMLITLSVVIGFKQEVRQKVVGFGSHIQVVNFDNNNTYQLEQIVASNQLLEQLQALPDVEQVQPFCTKPGIIKTDSAFQGIVIKGRGVASGDDIIPADNDFFSYNLVQGVMPEKPNEVLISQQMSQQLGLGLSDQFLCYFIDEKVRARKYTISGIYNTQFAEYDQLFIIGNLREVQRLNDWSGNEVSGIEIQLSDFSQLDYTADQVYQLTANRPDEQGNFMYTMTIVEQNPMIFSWLNLLDMNVVIIIILMLCVSAMCIISGQIILILDNITMIGTIKSLGANNAFVRMVFLYQASFLITKGILWGNVIGIALILTQYFTHLIPLDPATYYVGYVPMALSIPAWLILNFGTVLLSLLVMLVPSAIISRISPARVMHFE
ncbi:MAG: ABC transporter permease [Paludibacteraceae bacterium]|nr:ABC transporter permease [Paludibacteraceae bacterium]